jgi:FAD/FMN-containing dehydrogenase
VALAAATVGATAGATVNPAAAATDSWDTLRSQLSGDLVLPSDSGYTQAKQLQFAEFDAIHPGGIVYADTASDVRASVRFARRRGLGIRTRSGGHNYRGWSTGEGMVIDLSRINHATITGNTVHIGPGAQSIDALAALSPHNTQVIAGTCPTVCPGGFLSGGGIGYQTKKFGVGSDRVVSARVVLADGEIVRVSAHRDPDLFWALRGGGGGNFGIVVDFEVRPIQAPRMVFFNTTWAWDKAHDVFAAWQQWHLNTSNDLGSALIFMLPDAAPGAEPLVIITGGYHGPLAEAEAALAQLTSLVGAQPTSRAVSDLPYHEGMRTAYGCDQLTQDQCHREGTNPDALLHRTGFLREGYRFYNRAFTPSELNGVIAAWDGERVAGQRRFLHAMSLGGAIKQPARNASAFVHRDAEFIVGFTTQLDAPTPESAAAAESFVDHGSAVLNPIGAGAYVNFPGSNLPDWAEQYYAENYSRLLRVKRRYDPDNVFRHPRSIGSPSQVRA